MNLVNYLKPKHPGAYASVIKGLYNGIAGPAIVSAVPEKYSLNVLNKLANVLPNYIEPLSGPDIGLKAAVKHAKTANKLELIIGGLTYMSPFVSGHFYEVSPYATPGSLLIIMDGALRQSKLKFQERPAAFLGGWGYAFSSIGRIFYGMGKELFSTHPSKNTNSQ